MVPSHRIISKDAVEKLLNKYSIGLNNLPRLLDTDPQVKKAGAKAGDVVEIERDDLGKHSLLYKLVIHS